MAPPTLDAPTTPTPSLWRHADFLKLWIGQSISVFGSQFTQLALPLIAANLLRATPAQMGILGAAEFAPFLLLGLLAGVWVDRLPRRPILIIGDVGRAALLIGVAMAALAGLLSMTQLYVVGFLIGVLTVFFEIAYQAYLPALVARSAIVEGNSRLETSRSLAQVAGPGIAGAIIEVLTAPIAIILDAASFVVSGIFLGTIRRPEPAPVREGRRSMLAEVREGLSVVFGSPLLRMIAGSTGTSNFFSSAVGALFILFATRELHLTAASIGLIFSLSSLGGLAGAMTAGRLARRFGVGPVIVASSFFAGLWFVTLPLATPATAVPLLILAGLVGSFSNPVYNINQVSLRQAIVPERLQGRMNATMRFLVWGTMPLGSLFGGALGQVLGLRPAIIVGVAGGMLAFLWVLFSPVRTLQRIPEPAD